MNRCANNYWHYCIGEPKFEVEPEERVLKADLEESFSSGGHCKRNWRDCEYLRTLTELTADKLDALPTPAPIKRVESETTSKPKGKVKTVKETLL